MKIIKILLFTSYTKKYNYKQNVIKRDWNIYPDSYLQVKH